VGCGAYGREIDLRRRELVEVGKGRWGKGGGAKARERKGRKVRFLSLISGGRCRGTRGFRRVGFLRALLGVWYWKV